MKKCSVCGKEWEDSISFCADCGGATVEVEAAPVEGGAAPVDEVVAPVTVEEAPVEAETIPAKKQPKKWWLALIAGVAALAILVVGLLTNWFGLTAPYRRVSKAMKNTMTAKSYTLTITEKIVEEDYSYSVKSTGYMAVDEKKKAVTTRGTGSFVHEREYDGETEKSEYSYVSIIENDIQYEYQLDEDDKVVDATIEELEDYSKDFFKDRAMWDDPDWKHFLKQQGLSEYMNAGKMDDLVEEVVEEYLSDRRWLKETAGMTKKGNTYTFNPDVKDLFEDILDVVEDSKAFTNQAKKDLKEAISDTLEAIKDKETDIDIELSITIKGRYMTNIHIEIEQETDGEKSTREIDYAYSDINKTDVSKKDVDKVKSKVNDWLEEKGIVYDKCADCKKLSEIYKDKLCSDCYYTCAKCGEYGSLEKVSKRYCYDCYYVCDECGEYGSYEMEDGIYCYDHRYLCDQCDKRCNDINTVGEEEWCDDCYVCDSCGDSSPHYERDGKPVCYDCRYLCDKCEKPCSSTNTVGEEEWCEDCYVCAECGNTWPRYERDGKLVCSSCRYVCDKCEKACGSTNTVGEEEWCSECYVCDSCGSSWPRYMRDGKPVCYNCQYECEKCGEPCSYYYTVDGKKVCSDCWYYR